MSCARGNCHDVIVLATKDGVLDNRVFMCLQFGQIAYGHCMKPLFTDRALPEKLPHWGILVLESHHSSKFTMEWRTHSFIKIVYVLSGNGTFLFNKKRCSFSEGDVISIPPGTRNRIVDGPNAASSLYVCCVARSVLQFDPSLIPQLSCRALPHEKHFAHRVSSVVRRMVHTQQVASEMRPISMVTDALKLIKMICERSRETEKVDRRSIDYQQRIQQYIKSLPSHFFEETSINAAADQIDIPRRTFTKLFAEITGETWLQHVRRLAIEHAQHRLHETNLPVASIAFECGFYDLSTFYRQFQRHCGISPGRYRADAAEKNYAG